MLHHAEVQLLVAVCQVGDRQAASLLLHPLSIFEVLVPPLFRRIGRRWDLPSALLIAGRYRRPS